MKIVEECKLDEVLMIKREYVIKCRNWVRTVLHGQSHGSWCPSWELSRSVNFSINLKELLEFARKRFTEGFTVCHVLYELSSLSWTIGKYFAPQVSSTDQYTDRGDLHGHFHGTMGPRRKNANKPAPVTALQSEGHDESEASGSEDSPLHAEEGGSSSDNGENSGSKFDVADGTQSAYDLGGNAESEGGSQDDTSTSPPVAKTKTETEAREEAVNRKDEEEITDDDTMVMYVNA
uniref:Uncharacterized protein n=1 Tax=Solanum tuberosum TaxID=4113 RepID=M1D9N5_SOLTU